MDEIQSWAATNHFHLHPTQPKELRDNFRKQKDVQALVQVNGKAVENVDKVKLLGVIFRSDLKWNDHIAHDISKASKRMYFLIQLKRAKVNERELASFYTTCIRSVIEYACEVYHFSLPEYLCNQLERLQKRALRIIYSNVSYDEALALAKLSTLKCRCLSIVRNDSMKFQLTGHISSIIYSHL